MHSTTLSFAALVAATFLPAQDQKKPADQAPDPKTQAHGALAQFAGDWQISTKMEAMPGMEQASLSTGTEHAELICNGLWLKSTIDSTHLGKPFQGLSLVGYDPFTKQYQSIWVSSQDEPACVATGTWDEKTKTWTFAGNSPKGPVRSVYVFQDADNSVETCYLTGQDGKETEVVRITRTRGKAVPVRDATATTTRPASKELSMLAQDVGIWNCTTTSTMQGQPPSEEKCTEQVTSICGGRWTWSDFKGTMMGQPFEGHALTGWNEASKQFVNFWIDSHSATPARVVGKYDDKNKQIVFDGTCLDEQGNPVTIHQVYTQPDADTRELQMTFQGPKGPSEMKIAYKRAGA